MCPGYSLFNILTFTHFLGFLEQNRKISTVQQVKEDATAKALRVKMPPCDFVPNPYKVSQSIKLSTLLE